ncbi:DUF2066 domain-containing protein [Niveispirillum fermenti]|uniref:DUF2066 domain-containing protein n=1 Tax=Niveispirillum fermenti TaxID=1233113 RepID=UPI003A87260A
MPVLRTPALRKSLSAVLLAAGLALPAAAQGGNDLFTVRDVSVDIAAASPAAARDQGVREAQRKAFNLLFDRLTVDGTRAGLGDVPADSIDRMVGSFEVQEERTSATRYVGRLAIRFNPVAVRDFMRVHGVAYAEVMSKPVLVIPVDQTGDAPVLWQAETAWRQAWADLAPQGGLVPVIVPYGEAPDVADIGVDQALSGDGEALRRIAERYGAGEAAVVVATGSPAQGLTINVALHPMGGAPEHFTLTQSPVAGDPAGTAPSGLVDTGQAEAAAPLTVDPTLRAAVEAVTHRLEERWTAASVIQAGTESGMTVTVSFTDREGWLETRKRLASLPIITRATVVSLSREGASLDLRHKGGLEQLRTALAQRDLLLEDGPEGPALRLAR